MRIKEFTGKTTQEAIDNGLAELGVTIADVHVDVLQEGAKGLFGLFGLFSLSAILCAFGHTHVFCLVVAGLGGLALYLYVLLFTHFVLSFFKKTHSKYCAKAGAPALLAGRVCASGCEVHPGARRVSCPCLYMSA